MSLKGCVTGDARFVELWHKICDEQDANERKWIEELRKSGFKASHPNDGWVNRDKNEVHFAYPHFNDEANIGDLVMLGWHYDKKTWRAVRIVGSRNIFGNIWWKFDDAQITL